MPRISRTLLALAMLFAAFAFHDAEDLTDPEDIAKIASVTSTVSSTTSSPTSLEALSISTSRSTSSPASSTLLTLAPDIGETSFKTDATTAITLTTVQANFSSNVNERNEFFEVKNTFWECPNITNVAVDCSCDFPHTLRCTGDRTALQAISQHLKSSRAGMISLLDISVTGISILPAYFLEDVALRGLVISTGELLKVNENAFIALARPLQALGLPNNRLDSVPTAALEHLIGLERLDLSGNQLKTLEANSFKGLINLTHLDLCDNLMSQLSPQAFAALPALQSLKMRGNRLSVSALPALRGLKNLEELDLSSNVLIGPMGPTLLPHMPKLRFLTVSQNGLINVQQGALNGVRNLTYLKLSHNQIDVLEDHCFKHLSTLTRLDLANNRIVAVSSASLAHLEKLTTLDLTHNFLRSLTADLVVPLKSLEDLRLDDNDITMVANDVPTSKLRLKRLSLSDNPLNCDCTLLEFANWLSNSSLDEEDKASAVCATPPTLENGILTQVSPDSLLCGEPTPTIIPRVPLTVAQLILQEFKYNEAAGVNLMWHVEPCLERYTCDTLKVYEIIGNADVEIQSSPLQCDSTLMQDPCTLPVAISSSLGLQPKHKYRYCVVLLVPTEYDEVPSDLGLGCSEVITLEEDKKIQESIATSTTSRTSQTEITGIRVNISDQGFLQVDLTLAHLTGKSTDCELSVAVFSMESLVHRKKLICSPEAFVTVADLLPGRYKVCASLYNANTNLGKSEMDKTKCVEVQAFRQNMEVIILAAAAVSCAVLITVVLIGHSVIKRLRQPRIQTQCFLPAQEFEITHKAHYIKLLATTKV
ncbi:leucine-rich repeats and immunoglobulin-like domains protein 1 [Cephus cinctus]|uniref:Leucine-rich repeats and immunoglobulin-like domains protein 1 n=1 Tax=Cephus cinctus TaxID=211228 RepID=A0AAJ7FD73_CEPCN|nr:leucine-rich repeats and immunoglobulin-like domains protein 1 [Cephus cinctus]XP_015585958.1 leucine-rich repeats and immunoglobulin-like domains protein 1 [Cephus cinctus]